MTLETNEFGGDITEDYTPASAAERGDLIDEDINDGETDNTDDSGSSDTDAGLHDEAGDEDPSSEDSEASGDDGESDDTDDTDADADDDSEEGEAEADSDGHHDDADNKDTGQVPRSRLNKEADKRRKAESDLAAANAEIERLKAAQSDGQAKPKDGAPKPRELNVDENTFKDMQTAFLDEDTGTAMKLFKEILQANIPTDNTGQVDIEAIRAELRTEIADELGKRETHNKLSTHAESVFERYPELDHRSESADKDMIQEVIRLRNLNIDDGMEPTSALDDATSYVAFKYQLEDRKATKEKANEKRKKDVDVKAKRELAEKERGKLKGESSGKEKPLDISKLSESAFDKLSEEQKRKARGDYL